MALTVEEMRAKPKLTIKEIRVPAWDEEGKPPATVFIRKMPSEDRDAWEDDLFKSGGKDVVVNRRNIRARLAVKIMCDDKGVRLFKDADATELGQWAADALEQVYEEGIKLNGVTRKDEEEIEKNCVPGPSDASGSV